MSTGRTCLTNLRTRQRIVKTIRVVHFLFFVVIVIACVTLDLPIWIAALGAFGSLLAAIIAVAWVGQMRCPRCDVWFREPPPERFCESCGFDLDSPEAPRA